MSAVYDQYAHRVYAYALRHCGFGDADDVVSETFAIAWSRRESVPKEPLGWLIVTARNIISGRRRSDQRRARLVEVLAHGRNETYPAVEETVLDQQQVLTALDSLSEREREALLLVAWDGLDNASAASVARCSPRAFRARLMRARIHLAARMLPEDDDPAPLPAPTKAARTNLEGTRDECRSASA